MSSPVEIFDRALLARRRRRVACAMADHDFLAERIAKDFAERLEAINRTFPLALDLGAGTGRIGAAVAGLASVGCVISCDGVLELARRLPGPAIVADEEALPFADGVLDLVVSGLALASVNDLVGTLVQIRRALKPDGLFLGAVFGGETLSELREALLEAEFAETGGASPRVGPFADVRALGGLLQRAGFALPVVDRDVVRVEYASPLALMAELRAAGLTNVLYERSRRPLRRRVLARASAIYESRYRSSAGRVRATFEIITMTGWAPHESQQKPLAPGSAKARLADALGTREIALPDDN